MGPFRRYNSKFKKQIAMYYNTTNVRDKERAKIIMEVELQDDFILEIFKRHDYNYLTPSQVCEISEGYGKNWPITSVRRSLNTWTKRGRLRKLDEKIKGPFNRDEHKWKLI